MKSSSVNAIAVLAFLLVVTTTTTMGLTQLIQRRPNPRSCSEAQMCCQGQNNTCFVFGMRVDRSEYSRRCYCDTNCLIMGDCCMDYHHFCKSVDCQVGEWTEWSECDNGCGFGKQLRTRGVETFPDNGGNHCPALKQRRACVGYVKEICLQNELNNQEEERNERGHILPIKFGRFRDMKKYDPWKGILKNLYSKYFNEIFTRPTYRGTYRITATRHGCEKSEWANVLKINTTVCVECQPVAMNKEVGMRCLGHGVYRRDTAWKAVDVQHCHGTWQLMDQHESKLCEYSIDDEERRNFIFV